MKPDITVVVAWLKEAWDSIPAEMVVKSFLKCGISNALDGTEDDAIYEDEVDSATPADDDAAAVNNDDSGDETDDYTVDVDVNADIYAELFADSDIEQSQDVEGF